MREIAWPTTRALVGVSALSLVVIGLVDHATGTVLRVFPLYFVPVLLLSLRLGQAAGLAAALASALVWLLSNHLASPGRASAPVAIANGVVMALAFGTVALLGAAQQRGLQRERSTSRTDSLTGLLNGRGFYEAAATELARARRYGYPVTIAYVDLDGFKEINDRFGHAHGDLTLARVAEVIRALTRRSDVVGRLGGDEFALLLPQSDQAAAEHALKKVLAGLGRIAAAADRPVGASIGAVSFAKPPSEIAVLLHEADTLMYEAKAAGKNALRCRTVGEPG